MEPGPQEICNGIDDNCNGLIDEGLLVTLYRDADGDGFGDPNNSAQLCPGTAGWVSNNTDCNDNNAAINPNTIWYLDADNDGYYTGNGITQCTSPGPGYRHSGILGGNDCNDNNPNINPGATEICNGIDDNCNGLIDEGLNTVTYYQDNDGDGFGNPAISQSSCSGAPAGYVANNTDCNDNNAAINPNTVWYLDADNDGYYTGNGITQCTSPGPGYRHSGILGGNDCNDNNPNINPGATEICNGLDDNCNGLIDEGVQPITWYADADGDGYGNPAVTTVSCAPPPGHVSNGQDCDDDNPNINPGATEICNSLDDNCNGLIDEGVQPITWYADADGDGYGNPAVTTVSCAPPPGHVTNGQDCNDDNPDINPGATEICNGLDDNCNGLIDEGAPPITWYADADGDGYGNPAVTTVSCAPPPGHVSNGQDCDDDNPDINPGATEICNGLDDNCNGQIDEGVLLTFYEDADGDGFGDPATAVLACTAPPGYTDNGDDCDDGNPNVNPNALEIPNNGIDDNCDGFGGPVIVTDTAFVVGESFGSQGDMVQVPIYVMNFPGFRGFQFSVKVTVPGYAEILGFSPSPLLAGGTGYNSFSPDPTTLSLLWNHPQGSTTLLPDSSVVVYINLLLTGASGDCAVIAIENIPTDIVVSVDATTEIIPSAYHGYSCISASLGMSAMIVTELGLPVSNVEVYCTATADNDTTGLDGIYVLHGLQPGQDFQIVPHKDIFPKNGVNVGDITAIQRHVLGVEALSSPYKIIAADVNRSGSVNVGDIIDLSQLILGATSTMPNNTSWRFVPQGYLFANPAAPLLEPFPEMIEMTAGSPGNPDGDFIGIKVGDVNNTSNPSQFTSDDDLHLLLHDQGLAPGQAIDIPVRATGFNGVAGFQFELHFAPDMLEFQGVTANALSLSAASNVGTSALGLGSLPILWHDKTAHPDGLSFGPDEVLFVLHFVAKQPGHLRNALQLLPGMEMAVVPTGQSRRVDLNFNTVTSAQTAQTPTGLSVTTAPNPFHDRCSFLLFSPLEMEASLDLYAPTGQKLTTITTLLLPGPNQLSVSGDLFPASGVYLYCLRTAAGCISGKVVYE